LISYGDRLEMLRRAHEAKRSLGSMAEEYYIEVIYELDKNLGYVRLVDIAGILGVKASSVAEMLRRLERKGLIVYERYKSIRLTREGLRIAERISRRHEALMEILVSAGVDPETANIEAEMLEHFLSEETIEKLKRAFSMCRKGGKR